MEADILEVDVNGDRIFYVDKKILVLSSNKLSKLFSKSTGMVTKLKVIFHDFPGGADGFELVARYCYNGRIEITPGNAVILNYSAHYMEMDGSVPETNSLIDQTEKFLRGANSWTWSELIVALKQAQELIPTPHCSHIMQRVLECIAERVASPSIGSVCSSSPECLSFQLSCDTRSESTRSSCSQTTKWFEDLMFINVDLLENVIYAMLLQKVDHTVISLFLFYYHKSRLLGASQAEKLRITEIVISMLSLLKTSSVSCKGLFNVLRVSLSLKISSRCRSKLESMIGSQLDRATVDYLLLPSPRGKTYTYDVNLVMRLVKTFLLEGSFWSPPNRLNKVASLMDTYLAEVAPNVHLKPSKFGAMVKVLPKGARACHDKIYRAMDVYFKVHAGIREKEKLKICFLLNYEKLSDESLKHLARNPTFPPEVPARALITLKSNLQNSIYNSRCHKTTSSRLICETTKGKLKEEDGEQLLLNTKGLDLLSEKEKLILHQQRTRWRTAKLQSVSRVMPLPDVVKTKRYLPKCIRSFSKLCW